MSTFHCYCLESCFCPDSGFTLNIWLHKQGDTTGKNVDVMQLLQYFILAVYLISNLSLRYEGTISIVSNWAVALQFALGHFSVFIPI